MSDDRSAVILRDLDELSATDVAAGGKALGLARLSRLLPVPRGFVVIGAVAGDDLPAAVLEGYRALGGPVAVRSSAVGEDGASSSFAGQFESVLGVADERSLRAAFDRCLASLHSTRAAAYAGAAGEHAGRMAVVVQRMVDARAAGVVFTVDPVSMRRDRLTIDVVRGIGEALVSGHAPSDHYELSRQGEIVRRELADQQPVVDDGQLQRVLVGAITAERSWGVPLDLEWAIDDEGRLSWLQARPITTLVDLHELDVHHGDDHIYTRYNVGEMLPGAVCPLDLSTTAPAVDRAIQNWYVACGARARRTAELHTVAVRYGHLFFDLTAVLDFAANVAGATRETTMHAICGRPVAELRDPPPASRIIRTINGARYVTAVFAASRRIPRFERDVEHLRLEPRSTAAAMVREIDHQLPFLFEAYDVHIAASTASGLAGGLIEGILAKGKTPSPEHEAALAELLSGAGAESASMVRELEEVVAQLAADPSVAALCSAAPETALGWLRGPEGGAGGAAFAAFLRRHGHRAVRELSLQHPGWIDDPLPLVASIQSLLAARLAQPRAPRSTAAPASESPLARAARASAAMRWVVRFAHRAIRQREHTKSLLVQVCHRFKRAYRLLAERLVGEGLLAEPDLVFFLTHDELGRLTLQGQRALATLATQRRRVFAAQQRFEFADVSVGPPQPLEPPAGAPVEHALQGKPVCRGVVEGTARVVHGLAEAAAVQAGEILVAPVIDVGFSPYYHLIGGLATDLGSPMSHGAVVAREYGLPTVSNLRNATRVFRTGDQVVLDGDRGVLRRLERAPGGAVIP